MIPGTHHIGHFKQSILFIALSCLLLPNLFFIFGWYQLYISLPVSLGICYAIFHLWKSLVHSYLPAKASLYFTSKDFIYLLICLLLALILTETIGFHAHVPQPGDFQVRNPIYTTLIAQPWPIYFENGDYFVYYHAFWLPPALLAKLIGHAISPATILFVWSYLLIALSICLLFCKLKGRVLFLFIILLLFGTIIPEISHITAKFCEIKNIHMPSWLFNCGLFSQLNYVSLWTSMTSTFNSALPALLCLALIFSGMIPIHYWWIPAALIVQPTILCAGALFIWLVYKTFTSKHALTGSIKSPANWIMGVYVILVMLYMVCGGGHDTHNGVYFAWADEPFIGRGSTAQARAIGAFLLPTLFILPLHFLITPRLRRTTTYRGACLIAYIIPFIWIGMRNNEFMLKGSFIMFFLFAYLILIQYKFATSKRKILLSLFLLLSCRQIHAELNSRAYSDYGWSKEKIERHIARPENHTIDDLDPYLRSQFNGSNHFPMILREKPSTVER